MSTLNYNYKTDSSDCDDHFYGSFKSVDVEALSTSLSDVLTRGKRTTTEQRNFSNALKQEYPSLYAKDAPLTHVCLKNAEDFQQTMNVLKNILTEQEVDFRHTDCRIFGHIFKENSHCAFKLHLVNLIDQEIQTPALVAYRMEGCAFSLTSFFEEIKKSLCKLGFVTTDEEQDFDVEFDDEGADTFGFSYLNLSCDEELVDHWCERLRSGHFEEISSILLLLAYNGENARNLEIISHHKQRLVDSIFVILANQNCNNNICIVRNICKVIFQLAGNGLVQLSWEKVGTLMSILIAWSHDKPFDVNNPVTCSVEIQRTIALTLNALNLVNAPSTYSPLLQQLNVVAQNSSNETVSKTLGAFVSHIAVC